MLFELCADNRDFEVPRIFGSRSRREMMLFSCLLVLDSVTSAPQCIRQPRQRVYLKEGTHHTRLIRGGGLALMWYEKASGRRGPGWRIHGSVEDTKLSTNKQHTLSL
jgi:hypothetical protein